MFIVIEGIDGSGKSTIAQQLKKVLQAKNKTVALSSQPTHWLKKNPVDLTQLSCLEHIALFSADRGFDQSMLAMEIDQYDYVIRDRYALSTYAYNCCSELELAVYEGLNRNIIEPDLTIFIDSPLDICLDRISKRKSDTKLSHFETKDILVEARKRYLQKLGLINWAKSLIVNGEQSVSEIIDDILIKIDANFNSSNTKQRHQEKI